MDEHIVIKAPPKDVPLVEALEMLRDLPEGSLWYLKWTCPKCGERVTCNEPKTVYTRGYLHQEKANGEPCGALYTGQMFGCFLVLGMGNSPPGNTTPV